MTMELVNGAPAAVSAKSAGSRRSLAISFAALGEPSSWALGGALAFGIIMIVGFLLLVLWNGAVTFWPKPIEMVTLRSGEQIAGEPSRSDIYRPGPAVLAEITPAHRARIAADGGQESRTLYRVGNFDLYNDDYRWVSAFDVERVERPRSYLLVERLEWGPFIGQIKQITVDGVVTPAPAVGDRVLVEAHAAARQRWAAIHRIEKNEIGAINHSLESERLALRRVALRSGDGSPEHRAAIAAFAEQEERLKVEYDRLSAQSRALRDRDARDVFTFVDVKGTEKQLPLSSVVRLYAANDLSYIQKWGVYLSRWWEFVSSEPREANTEGGVLPAIFGTFAMTVLLSLFVAPFGVITALYLREYAAQGRLVAFVRISVNNLAGVPSIVYGVFGLGFFVYILGGTIDDLFYPERLPNPTFGRGGILWSSLTLALLTVPVVIVATEEALAAVPRSMREGSLACGASKWQTIRNIVLPRAMPGIMTGLILAMARGAGEVAPLMLVGVVKLAPELPIDGLWPFIHLDRSFMHLGFHIYDVGFQSRNSEAGKPMVFVTTMLLIVLIASMNAFAIIVRNRLKRQFAGSQF